MKACGIHKMLFVLFVLHVSEYSAQDYGDSSDIEI
jgi:hypothetical protein